MAARGGDFTAAVVARCAAEVPFYGELPRRTLDGEVTRSITAVHELLLRALRQDGVMGPGDLTRLIEWSGRRAEERVPLEAVIAAYLVGAEVWWQVLAETAEPEELTGAGAKLLACLHAAMPAVVLAHRNAQEDIRSEDKRVRRALLTALLAYSTVRGTGGGGGGLGGRMDTRWSPCPSSRIRRPGWCSRRWRPTRASRC